MADTQINGTLSLKDTDISGSLGVVNPIEANLTPEPEVSSQLMASRTIALPSVLNDLGDVDISSPQQNEILTYNGSKWVNGQGGSGGGTWGSITGTLSDQTDLQNALDGKIASSEKGANNGVATLGNDGKVPASQLPADNVGIPEEELRDTVGWTCKNLLPYPTGTREVVSVDGTITANADMYLSDYIEITEGLIFNISVKTGLAYARTAYYDNSKTFISRPVLEDITAGELSEALTIPSNAKYVRICVEDNSGANFTNMMLRKSSIADDTYEPYHDSVESEIEQIYSANGVLGAKNLLNVNATSKTENGITFTVNSDGSITANGTATAQTTLSLKTPSWIHDVNSDCIISGAKNGSSTTYEIYLWDEATSVAYRSREGVDAIIPASVYGHRVNCQMMVRSGAVLSNVTVYPMIRLASDTDGTYQPYAKTNYQLTQDNRELTEKIPFELIRTSVTESSGNNVRIPAGSDTDSRITTSSTVIPTGSVAIKYSAVNVYNGYATITLAESITSKDVGIMVLNH